MNAPFLFALIFIIGLFEPDFSHAEEPRRLCLANYLDQSLLWSVAGTDVKETGTLDPERQWRCITLPAKLGNLDVRLSTKGGTGCKLSLKAKSPSGGWVEVRKSLTRRVGLECSFHDERERRLTVRAPYGPTVELPPVPAHPISLLPTSMPAFLAAFAAGPLDTPVMFSKIEEFDTAFPLPLSQKYLRNEIKSYFDNGGGPAYFVRYSNLNTGLKTLDLLGDVSLLVVPDLALLQGAAIDPAMNAVLAYARSRDAFVIFDPPSTAGASRPQELLVWWSERRLDPELASYGALYYPQLVVGPDNVMGNVIGPAGALAAIYGRTDRDSGVWQAPAGNSHGAVLGAVGLSQTLSQDEQLPLAQKGLNVLRLLPNYGYTVWGASTLALGTQGASYDYRYVHIQRLKSAINSSIYRGLEWASFEANNEMTWAKVRASTGDFMSELWAKGAMVGTSADTSYQVQCDAVTTSPRDVDQGHLYMRLSFAPQNPAEFVTLDFTLQMPKSDD